MYASIIRPCTKDCRHIYILDKVLSCLVITGTTKFTSEDSQEIIVDIPPLELFIKTISAKSAGQFVLGSED